MMRTLIVDDETPARSRLKRILAVHGEVEVIGEARDGVEAVAMIGRLKPDLVFLDVQMPGLDGLEVLRSLPAGEAWPLVIFATAFDQYALAAFEANAVGYLLKPIDRDKLALAVERAGRLAGDSEQARVERSRLDALTEATQSGLSQVMARFRTRRLLIPVEEVFLFRIEDGLVKLRTRTSLFSTDYSLDVLAGRLADPPFFRAHRAAIVNLAQVGEIASRANGALTLTLKDQAGTRVEVSERRSVELRKRLPR